MDGFLSLSRWRERFDSARERQPFQWLAFPAGGAVQHMDNKCVRARGSMLSAGYKIPPKRHHVANTFKAEGDHVQGLREPFSRPRFRPLIVRQTDISAQEQGTGKMDTAAIAITTCIALYLVLRLTLRTYFPPDT